MFSVRSLFALLVVVLGCVSVSHAQTFACGGAGYNLSTIGDLTTTVNGYTWSLNPCVPITTGSCAGKNATFCQGTNVLNYYNPLVNVVTWTTITGGVMSRSINGQQDSCSTGTSVRTGAVEYICNATATTAFLSNVEEVETCQYLAQVQTSLVCAAPIPVSTSPVGLPFSSLVCGGGLFDLTSIDIRDFTFSVGSTPFAFRPCTPVNTTTGCPAGTSFCQSNAFALSAGNGLAQTYTLQNDGLIIQSQDGAACGVGDSNFGWPREANVYLQCNASATTPQLVSGSFFEGSNDQNEPTGTEYCHYTVTIQTAAVCTRLVPTTTTPVPLAAPTFACGGAGYDLSLIAAVDMTYTRPAPYLDTFFVNPCRPLTQGPCASQGASVCQGNLTGGGGYTKSVLTYLNPANAPIQWSSTNYNGAQAIQSFALYGDTGCGSYNTRTATVVYYCAAPQQGGALSKIVNVTETSTCQFTIYIATTVVCSTALATSTAVGYPFVSTTCGGGLFNLAQLDSTDFMFNTSSTQAYWWRPCSAATSYACAAANATFCQYNGGNPLVWALATTLGSSPNVVNTYTLQPNGLLIQSQDGTLCGSIPRAASTLLVCNATATTPYLLSYNENSGTSGYLNNGQPYCHYSLVLATNQVCAGSAAAPSNSTSSTGGTVIIPPGGGSAGSSSGAAAPARSSSSAAAAPSNSSASSSGSVSPPSNSSVSSTGGAVSPPTNSSVSSSGSVSPPSNSSVSSSGSVSPPSNSSVSSTGGAVIPPSNSSASSSAAVAPSNSTASSSAAPARAASSSSSAATVVVAASSSSAAVVTPANGTASSTASNPVVGGGSSSSAVVAPRPSSSSSSSSSSSTGSVVVVTARSSSSSSTAAGGAGSVSSSSSGSSAPVVVNPFATSSSSDTGTYTPPNQNVNGAASMASGMAAVVAVAMVAASMALLL